MFFSRAHHVLEPLGDVEQLDVLRLLRKALGDALDHLVARIAGRVHRVAEADHDLARLHAADDVGFSVIRVFISG